MLLHNLVAHYTGKYRCIHRYIVKIAVRSSNCFKIFGISISVNFLYVRNVMKYLSVYNCAFLYKLDETEKESHAMGAQILSSLSLAF